MTTKRTTMTTIEISIEEWASYNRIMIDMLRALEGEGEEGLSTRQLLQKVSRTHNAQEIIKRAEEKGLIRRVSQSPKTKGNWLVINYLTPRGKELLRKLSSSSATAD